MPENTVKVDRTTRWGNPFRVGGWFCIGDPRGRQGGLALSFCEAANEEIAARTPGRFTLIESKDQAVEFFERLMQRRPWKLDDLRGKHLACWCALDERCHADTLLRLANAPRRP